MEVDTLKVNKILEVGGVNIIDRMTEQEKKMEEQKAKYEELEKRIRLPEEQ